MQSEIRTKTFFDKIRYSQCWEDPKLLYEGLRITPEDDVLSISSGGCNTLALLLKNPQSVTAIDFNLSQNCLLELKVAALQNLDYADFIAFLGVRPIEHRWELYQNIRVGLSPTARGYWDTQRTMIEQGVLHVGRFENYLRMFRQTILPLVHTHRTIEQLLSLKTLEEQKCFYESIWDNRRWRFLFRVFFGKLMLGRLGRDPEFFKYVQIENVGEHYLQRAKYALTEIPIQGNFYAEHILTGAYSNLEQTHPYLIESNFQKLRENLAKLKIVTGELEKFLDEKPEGSFSKFNLSDIFEWMSQANYEALLRAIMRASRDGARLCYWNNLVLREHPSSLDDRLQSHRELAQQLHFQDRSFVYRNFVVESVHKPSAADALDTISTISVK
ncbi:BtaA family protein [Candidatus Acetothermia bacterium]|nr:BtaA family protein [Candidatus Acetothermia bacterium]